jgi:hypothetical protein
VFNPIMCLIAFLIVALMVFASIGGIAVVLSWVLWKVVTRRTRAYALMVLVVACLGGLVSHSLVVARYGRSRGAPDHEREQQRGRVLILHIPGFAVGFVPSGVIAMAVFRPANWKRRE